MSPGGHEATKINHLSIKFEKRQRNEEENWSLSHFEGHGSRVPTSGSRTLSTGGKSNFALATVMIAQRLLFSVQFSKSSNTKPCQYCQYLLTINLVIFSGSPTDLLNGGKTAMFPKDQQVPPRLRVRQVPAAALSSKKSPIFLCSRQCEMQPKSVCKSVARQKCRMEPREKCQQTTLKVRE